MGMAMVGQIICVVVDNIESEIGEEIRENKEGKPGRPKRIIAASTSEANINIAHWQDHHLGDTKVRERANTGTAESGEHIHQRNAIGHGRVFRLTLASVHGL